MMDQIETLRWVKRNIAAFDGDHHCVTIFGESAGGGSVARHLISLPAERRRPERRKVAAWPAYDPKSDACMEFGDVVAVRTHLYREACDLSDATNQIYPATPGPWTWIKDPVTLTDER